jgi:Fe-S-cluster containining protein
LNDDSTRPSPTLDLPLVDLPGAHPCSGCGACCTYVATQIDDPSTFKQYENIYWYLTHENIGVYIDWEGDWYLEVQTRCRNLTEARTCGIYVDRPLVCSSSRGPTAEELRRQG